MAIVPTSQPTVSPSGSAPVYQDSRAATADAFGALQGRAMLGLGETIGKIGAEGAKIAAHMAIGDDEREAKQLYVGLSNDIRTTNYGDGTAANPGFYSQSGEGALQGYDGAKQSIQGALEARLNSASSQRVRDYLTASAAPLVNREYDGMARHVMGERTKADNGAGMARIDAAGEDAMARWNDPASMQSSIGIVNAEIAQMGQRNGWGPDVVAMKQRDATSKVYDNAVRAAAASGDIGTASQMFKQYSPQMDAVSRVRLAEHLEPKLLDKQASGIVNMLLHGEAADGAPTPGEVSGSTPIADAIAGQESRGNANVHDSVDGARGKFQIMPATFRQYAKPGEDIANHADNEAVGRRIIQDLSDRYKGDPARVATAYFSGPGNVAPVGSATPFIHDAKDGNGKSTSSYVNDVLTRMGRPTTTDSAADTVFKTARTGAAAAAAMPERERPDFEGMAEKVLASTGDNPKLQAAVMSKLAQAQSTYNMQTRVQRETMTNSLKDTEAALRDGQLADIPETQIRHVFDKPTADKMMTALHEAQDDGQVYTSLKFASPQERQAALDDLATGLGPISTLSRLRRGQVQQAPDAGAPADAGTDNVTGYADRQRALGRGQAIVSKIQTELDKDAAGYVRQEPGVAAAYAAVKPGDAAGLQAAVEQSHAVQAHMGVADSDIRTLTNAQVADTVKQLHTVDPEKGDMGAQLDGIARQYGKAWPDVFKDLVTAGKLDPAYQTLAIMDQPSQVGPRQNLQRALQMKAQIKGEFQPPPSQKVPLEQSLETTLADFRATTTNGGSQMFQSVVQPAVRDLATYYTIQGIDASTAATRAYDEIISQKYDISGPTRTPKGLMGATLTAGARVQAGLDETKIAPGGPTVREAQNGIWATTPDGKGVSLMAPSRSGGYLPVRGSDGNYITMNFGDLPRGVSVPAAPSAAAMPGVMN